MGRRDKLKARADRLGQVADRVAQHRVADTRNIAVLPLDEIRMDGGTQPRSQLNQGTIDEYAADMQSGDKFPPIDVFYDGQDYWLADGFHRVHAATQIGWSEFEANVHQGDRRAAILHSVGVNASHGLRRTNEDKRRAVMALLSDEEWGKWSDREIGRRCRVSHPFVAKIREDVTGNISSERTYITKHGTVATMQTDQIQGANEARSAQVGKKSPTHSNTATTANALVATPEIEVIQKAADSIEAILRLDLNDLAGLTPDQAAVLGRVLDSITPQLWTEDAQGPFSPLVEHIFALIEELDRLRGAG